MWTPFLSSNQSNYLAYNKPIPHTCKERNHFGLFGILEVLNGVYIQILIYRVQKVIADGWYIEKSLPVVGHKTSFRTNIFSVSVAMELWNFVTNSDGHWLTFSDKCLFPSHSKTWTFHDFVPYFIDFFFSFCWLNAKNAETKLRIILWNITTI